MGFLVYPPTIFVSLSWRSLLFLELFSFFSDGGGGGGGGGVEPRGASLVETT